MRLWSDKAYDGQTAGIGQDKASLPPAACRVG